MKIKCHIKGVDLFCLSTFLSLATVSSQAAPAIPPTVTPPTVTPPTVAPPTVTPPVPKAPTALDRFLAPLHKAESREGKEAKDPGKLLGNMILDYGKAAPYSAEVLSAKVTVQLKGASFLSALAAVMDASPKTCRIECRQVHPLRLSVNVKEAPVSNLLDSLAKLGGARLYVLPSKLIIAPEAALTEEEKKKSKLYGVLLTSTTLPDTPGAKALTIPDVKRNQQRSILDLANTKISVSIDDYPIGSLLEGQLYQMSKLDGHYGVAGRGPFDIGDWASSVSFNFQDMSYADALASLAHLIDCELYMTPTNFLVMPRTSSLSTTSARYNTQNTLSVFAPFTPTFADPSADNS